MISVWYTFFNYIRWRHNKLWHLVEQVKGQRPLKHFFGDESKNSTILWQNISRLLTIEANPSVKPRLRLQDSKSRTRRFSMNPGIEKCLNIQIPMKNGLWTIMEASPSTTADLILTVAAKLLVSYLHGFNGIIFYNSLWPVSSQLYIHFNLISSQLILVA